MDEQTLVNESIAERIRQRLLSRISEGTYQAGDRLRELTLAKEFDTSQAPVREALRSLEAINVVETRPRRGTHVRSITNREIADTYQVRGRLESLAGELAAPCFQGNANSLWALAERVDRAVADDDIAAYASQDVAFHHTIVAEANNAPLLRSWTLLGFGVWTQIFLSRTETPLANAAADHADIVRALEAGDGQQASALLRQHSERFRAMLALESENKEVAEAADAPAASHCDTRTVTGEDASMQ
jgi:DNA-binding GntR family transcriptional regulator